STTVTPVADLSISKSSTPDPYVPGATLTYKIVVTNNGPSAVTNATVTDTVPAALTSFSWTCAASGAGSCNAPVSGSGNINTTVNLPSGTQATFTLTGTVPPATTGTLINSATVSAPPGTV